MKEEESYKKDEPIFKSLELATVYMMGYRHCMENHEPMYRSFARDFCKKNGMSYLDFSKKWNEEKKSESLLKWEYFHHKAKYLFHESLNQQSPDKPYQPF